MSGAVAVNDDAPTPINADLSDLFFNRDNDAARLLEKGKFAGWNEEALREDAAIMLGNLERLGVVALVAPDELVRDFLDRA